MRALRAAILLVLVLVLAGACREQDGDEHRPGASGEVLFSTYCARCHGSDGAGNFLRGVPANRGTALGRAEVVRLIRQGSAQHRRMKTFPKLSRREAMALAEYLEVLAEKAPDGPFWEVPPVPGAPR